MRFRTQVADVSILTRVIQSIGKVANRCILKLTPDKIHMICLGDTDGTQIWSQMQVDSIFQDYRIESNFQNHINLEVSPDTLLKALRSANNAYSVILRLAKRNKDPLLSFSISSQSRTGAKLEVVQDVLIKVLKPAEMSRIVEPLCPEPDVHIILPKLLDLRTVTEHMRSLSDVVTLSANKQGQLRLSVMEHQVSLDTTWSNLAHPTIDASQSSTVNNQLSDPSHHKSVNLEIKSFLKFLSSYVVATTTIACICSNHCAIFYVYISHVDKSSGVMTFFLPGVVRQD
ncbi:related to protein hus1, required for S-M and DNA damage checkpoints [Melanopsichium pennsylvanicum]|uniref:Checkpoint protein n=1 Tax=Melanopsichium pennsylvanicum TaxID=63383 RepID=A0AAJ4XTG2_9BASI|nr:related to protein hus1, required for S-M and DNA damage checkpoints [Melanopsichium pennsylvanicum]